MMASSTSKGYFMSPSTSPGESTKVTRLKRFCRDVHTSVPRYSDTPGGQRGAAGVNTPGDRGRPPGRSSPRSRRRGRLADEGRRITFELLQRFEVWVEMQGGVPLERKETQSRVVCKTLA